MKYSAVLIAFVAFLSLTFQLFAADPLTGSNLPSVEALGWLSGAWAGEQDGNATEEQWMVPKGGMMLGINRSVSKGGKVSFEFLRIGETDGGLIYFASPSGRAATQFKLKELKAQNVTFENLDHDFPQRIIYRREKDTVHAKIEGKFNGHERAMEWTWKLATQPTLPF